MPHIRPHGAGWQIIWRENGEKRSKTFGPRDGVVDRKTAEQTARLIQSRVERRRPGVEGKMPLEDVLDLFYSAKRAKRGEWTWRTYAKHIKSIKARLPCALPIGDISAHMIDDFHARRAQETSETTANKELTTLATAWNWAIKRRLAEAPSPVSAIERFEIEEADAHPCPKAAFVRHLLALREELRERRTKKGRDGITGPRLWIRKLYPDILRVLWHTGFRIGEVCRWTAEDIDLEKMAIRVRAARNKGGGKRGYRWTALPIQLRRLFQRRLALKGSHVFATHEDKSCYVALYRFRDQQKWDERFPEAHFHAFRHSYVSRAEAAGMKDSMRAALVGHKSVKITEHYTERELELLRKAQQVIERHSRKKPKAI